MTDTCNPARRFCQLLIKAITQIVIDEGMDKYNIKIFEAGERSILIFIHLLIEKYLTGFNMCLYNYSFLRLLAPFEERLVWQCDN